MIETKLSISGLCLAGALLFSPQDLHARKGVDSSIKQQTIVSTQVEKTESTKTNAFQPTIVITHGTDNVRTVTYPFGTNYFTGQTESVQSSTDFESAPSSFNMTVNPDGYSGAHTHVELGVESRLAPYISSNKQINDFESKFISRTQIGMKNAFNNPFGTLSDIRLYYNRPDTADMSAYDQYTQKGKNALQNAFGQSVRWYFLDDLQLDEQLKDMLIGIPEKSTISSPFVTDEGLPGVKYTKKYGFDYGVKIWRENPFAYASYGSMHARVDRKDAQVVFTRHLGSRCDGFLQRMRGLIITKSPQV